MTNYNNSSQKPSILFISNVERSDAIVRSQGIPLVDHLSRQGFSMGLLSMETVRTLASEDDRVIRDRLGDRVQLHPVRMDRWMWLKGWIRKLLWGIIGTLRVQKRHRYQVLHARSFEPAVMAWLATRLYGGKWIYDTRNFYWEEKVELGRIGDNVFAKCGFAFDRYLVRKADRVVAVTEAAREIYGDQINDKEISKKIEVIHNNFDPARFGLDDGIRETRRQELGIQDRIVLVYSGSLVPWNCFEEMARFCSRFQTHYPIGLPVWCSYEWSEDSKRWAGELISDEVRLLGLAPEEVGDILRASDVGMMFLAGTISRRTTIPIKFAEYLACGLPVVLNAGLIDPEAIVKKYRVGVVLPDFSNAAMDRGIDQLWELLQDPELKHRAHEVATKEFHFDQAIESYRQCYQNLMTQ